MSREHHALQRAAERAQQLRLELLGRRRHGDPKPWRGRFGLYAVGVFFLVIGLKGILHNDLGFQRPAYWAKLLVAGTLIHDLVIAPVVIGVAVAIRGMLPDAYRAYVASGLVVSGIVTALAWPGLRGYGDKPDNASVDPLNYATGLIIVLAVVWAGVLALVVRRALQRHGRRSG